MQDSIFSHAAGRIDALAAIRIEGADASAFAQRIFANDVTALAPGEWQWNCLLSPQGRVLSLFRLLHESTGQLVLVLPVTARSLLVGMLRRYVLRAKLLVSEDTRRLATGSSTPPPGAGAVLSSGDGHWLALVDSPLADIDPGRDLSAEMRARELAQGIVWMDAGSDESFTPQALGLERLQAFSVRKGCYPGQEIVARMHFLGQNKRELRRYASDLEPLAGTPVCSLDAAATPLGHVVSTAATDAGFELLAVLRAGQGEAGVTLSGKEAARLRALALLPPPLPVGVHTAGGTQ